MSCDLKWKRKLFYAFLTALAVAVIVLISVAHAIGNMFYAAIGWFIALVILPIYVSMGTYLKITTADSAVLSLTSILMIILTLWLILSWNLCISKSECHYYYFTLDVTQALAPFIVAFTIAVQIWTIKRGGEARPA